MMFGGLYDNAPTFLDDTWEYNVENKEWIEMEIIGDNPSPRMRHNFISIGDNKLMLFGGQSYSQKGEYINDLWEYDVINHTWTEKATNSIKPLPRQDFGLAYSPDNHCIVLFGGWVDVFVATNDTWIYDIEKDEWEEVYFNEGDVRPAPRYSMELAYVGNNKFMLFGGGCLSGDTAYPNDTWIFDLKYKVWRECIILSEDTPDSGCAYGMTTIGNKTYMFGGFYQGEANNDLWEFTLVENNFKE